MKQTFIGDIHGKWGRYMDLLDGKENTIQVGDFGVGFKNDISWSRVKERMSSGNHRYIRGNHDSPLLCREDLYCIYDGYFENGIFFMGGAKSIGRHRRIEGQTWWADEQLSYNALGIMFEKYMDYRPEVVVTHDCPDMIARAFFPWYTDNYPSRTRQALDTMFQEHKPKAWVFGHWHQSKDELIHGTRFICLAELETLELEL